MINKRQLKKKPFSLSPTLYECIELKVQISARTKNESILLDNCIVQHISHFVTLLVFKFIHYYNLNA